MSEEKTARKFEQFYRAVAKRYSAQRGAKEMGRSENVSDEFNLMNKETPLLSGKQEEARCMWWRLTIGRLAEILQMCTPLLALR